MTHQVKGVVDRCTTRDQQTSRGMAQIYGIIVDGIEVETGFKKEHEEGEMVNIEVKWNYGKWNRVKNGGDGLPPAVAGGPAKPAAFGGNKGGFTPKGRGTFPVDPKDGSISIIRQNSLTHATKIVHDMILATDHSGNYLFAPKDQQEYLTKVLEVAMVLTDFSSGNDIMKMQKAMEANKAVMNG